MSTAPAPGMVPITFTSALVHNWFRALSALALADTLLHAAADPRSKPKKLAHWTQVLADLLGPDVYR